MFKLERWRIFAGAGIIALAVLFFQSMQMLTNASHEETSYVNMVGMSLCVVSMGLTIIVAVTLWLDERANLGKMYFLSLVGLVALDFYLETLELRFEGDLGNSGLQLVGCYVPYMLTPLMIVVFWRYLCFIVGPEKDITKKMDTFMFALLFLDIILIMSNALFGWLFVVDERGNYQITQNYGYISFVLPAVMMIFCEYLILRHIESRRKKYSLSMFPILPVIGAVMAMSIIDIGLMVLFTFFAILIIYGNFYVGRSSDIIKKDAELTQQRAAVLVSQIRPHFLYNSLTSIMNISGTPMATRDAIVEFGKYLRGNLDTLTQKSAIPVMSEISHVENFIELENLEYGGKLNLELDIKDRNFLIPALTLQVLVELRIQEGFVGDRRSGTIHIKTELSDTVHVITIYDDGVPADLESLEIPEEKEQVGLYSVKSRLEEMVGGTIHAHNDEDYGTVLTIAIPKAKAVR